MQSRLRQTVSFCRFWFQHGCQGDRPSLAAGQLFFFEIIQLDDAIYLILEKLVLESFSITTSGGRPDCCSVLTEDDGAVWGGVGLRQRRARLLRALVFQQHVLTYCDGHLLDLITELCLQQFFRVLFFWILWKNESRADVGGAQLPVGDDAMGLQCVAEEAEVYLFSSTPWPKRAACGLRAG